MRFFAASTPSCCNFIVQFQIQLSYSPHGKFFVFRTVLLIESTLEDLDNLLVILGLQMNCHPSLCWTARLRVPYRTVADCSRAGDQGAGAFRPSIRASTPLSLRSSARSGRLPRERRTCLQLDSSMGCKDAKTI